MQPYIYIYIYISVYTVSCICKLSLVYASLRNILQYKKRLYLNCGECYCHVCISACLFMLRNSFSTSLSMLTSQYCLDMVGHCQQIQPYALNYIEKTS